MRVTPQPRVAYRTGLVALALSAAAAAALPDATRSLTAGSALGSATLQSSQTVPARSQGKEIGISDLFHLRSALDPQLAPDDCRLAP
jgi:hypothetical protein